MCSSSEPGRRFRFTYAETLAAPPVSARDFRADTETVVFPLREASGQSVCVPAHGAPQTMRA